MVKACRRVLVEVSFQLFVELRVFFPDLPGFLEEGFGRDGEKLRRVRSPVFAEYGLLPLPVHGHQLFIFLRHDPDPCGMLMPAAYGDVFPTQASRMKPFAPVAPNGKRSFPTKNPIRGVQQWNHYYIRCINAEVRLWVNGEEVSGGTSCSPATGYMALESEGSPIEFRNLKLRELP